MEFVIVFFILSIAWATYILWQNLPKPHTHVYDTKLYITETGKIEVVCYCGGCMHVFKRDVYNIKKEDWQSIGRKKGFFQAEETTQKRQQQQKSQQPPPRQPSNDNTWWRILGVNQNASKEQINRAWKTLASVYHPDNKKTGDTNRMAIINNARDVGLKQARG